VSPRRHLRPTFLLRCVSLLLAIGIFLISLALSTGTTVTVATIVILAGVWFIGIEAGFFPLLLATLITRSADKTFRPSSIWFYDRDSERKDALDSFHKDSSENPTVR
jgi:hypothetical protein